MANTVFLMLNQDLDSAELIAQLHGISKASSAKSGEMVFIAIGDGPLSFVGKQQAAFTKPAHSEGHESMVGQLSSLPPSQFTHTALHLFLRLLACH